MKQLLHYATLAAFIMSGVYGYAQSGKVKKANKKFEELAYVDARNLYLDATEKGDTPSEVLKKLGDSYYFTADYREASQWYGQLVESGADVPAEYYFRYAQSLKSGGNYIEADQMMEAFNKASAEDIRAEMFEKERDYLKEIAAQSGRYSIQRVNINTKLQDFSPSFYGEQLVFSSNRENSTGQLEHVWNEQPFLDLYIVKNPMSESPVMTKLNEDINTKYHESSSVFTEDGNVMYFTRNNYTNKKFRESGDGTNKLKLYRSKKENGVWGKPTELPFNSDEYSVAHPALSPDGRTLYFASDMPGTKGLSDIWKVSVSASGGFGTPENLGEMINTEGRETFPFVSAKNKLFFATDGHVGLGGLDVFVSQMDEQGTPGDAYNAGKPVNGPADDFGLILNEDTGKGYFSSSRGTGEGNDDIYAFTREQELITDCAQNITGVTRDGKTNAILSQAKVTLKDAQNQVITQTTSTVAGDFSFADVDCGSTYVILAEKMEYESAEAIVKTNENAGSAQRDLYLNPEIDLTPGTDLGLTLELNPIYFDLDKSNIRPDAALELERVIAVMKKYPNLKLDVRSHTDSRANDTYNLRLSQRRNVETIRYIVEKGSIDATRLTGNGYGETRLLNACGNNIPCNEAEHQLNRRSEFIIVEK